MEDFRVTVSDIRSTGHCALGIRRWFERNGFDFRHVLRNGVLASEMEATGDGQGIQVVERLRARRKG